LEGDVEKLGGNFKNKWQKRRLKLYSNVLLYGKERSGVFNVNGEIQVSAIGACIHKENGMGKKNYPGFELKVVDEQKNVRTFKLAVMDAEKCLQWVSVIKECTKAYEQQKRQKKAEQKPYSPTDTAPLTSTTTSTIQKDNQDENTSSSKADEVDEDDDVLDLHDDVFDAKTEEHSDDGTDDTEYDAKSTAETDTRTDTETRSIASRTDIVCLAFYFLIS
jgi:hypothetical protein